MTKFAPVLILALCATCVLPAISISRWFSSSYYDLQVTLRRYGHCVSDLPPLKGHNMNETEFLIQSMKSFLDQGNYDNEQLANVSALMDSICRSDIDSNYPISVHIDVDKYSNNGTGKINRCKAIDEAMDAMFGVFRRASLNKSEPLDFSVIQFYPNPANKAASYYLADLINTSWIKSDTILENVCKITDSVKEYVQSRASNSIAQDRSQQQPSGIVHSLIEMIDRILEPLLGLQKRFYWEGNNRYEIGYSRISNGLGSLRGTIGSTLKSTRSRVANIFSSSVNSTAATTTANTTLSSSSTVTVPAQQRNLTNMSATSVSPAPVSLNRTSTTVAPTLASRR